MNLNTITHVPITKIISSIVITASATVAIGGFLFLIILNPLMKAELYKALAYSLPEYGKRYAIAASHDLIPGSLFKGASFSTVYFLGDDFRRYVFPNTKTYHTWYPDFSQIVTIPDQELANFPLTANVTYRPGIRLVKIESIPKVYVVDNGAYLRWIPTEELAQELYGTNWNKQVDDIPVTFFIDYTIGPSLETKEDFNRQQVLTDSPDIITDWIVWKTARRKAREETETPTVFPQTLTGGGGGATTPIAGGGGGTVPTPTPSPPSSTPSGDTIPPVITGITVGGITISTATISWQTDEPTIAELLTSQDLATFMVVTSTTKFATTYTIPITTLTPDTTHFYKIIAEDEAGNTQESEVDIFKTHALIIIADTTPPITTVNPSGGTYTSTQSITLTPDEPATIYYTTDGTTPDTTAVVYTGPFLIAIDTTLKFFGVDTAGNQEAVQTEIYTITTPPSIPTCENSIQETGEQCDGSDLAGQTCTTRGFDGGTLSCTASCTL